MTQTQVQLNPKYKIGQPVKFTSLRLTAPCTATGMIDGYQSFKGEIYYSIKVHEPIGDNSLQANKWIQAQKGLLLQIPEEQVELQPFNSTQT